MLTVSRVLDREAVESLADYESSGGGTALEIARQVGPEALADLLSASGLRGRGGAGFPTGLKWQTVAASRSEALPTTVVVNAAEGEPGTFKDRELLRINPYRVLEGAAIAAIGVGAPIIRIGIKSSFGREVHRLELAIAEATAAGWFDGIDIGIVLGPDAYLFGEETAMLEVIEGRQPFPRVTPPFRRGLETGDTRSAAGVHLATLGGSDEPPALVDNVETLANVPLIVSNGADWFRELGTDKSPGTIIVTITGATRRDGVAEVPMGTTLREAIETIGFGPAEGSRVGVVLSGTANAMIPASLLDTPLTHEAMRSAGTGLGSAGFIVFDDQTDPVAIAQGVSRFLGVESCGQCEPCKMDGLELSGLLTIARHSEITPAQVDEIDRRVQTVSIGARCNLARQQEDVVGSLMRLFGDVVEGRTVTGTSAELPAVLTPVVIAPIADLVGGVSNLSSTQTLKQPDWSYGQIDSGIAPAARLGNTEVHIDTATRPHRWEEWSPHDAPFEEHPLAIIDEAHDLLDRLIFDALTCAEVERPAKLGKLAHITKVHMDVTRRVLYPTARRFGGEEAELLADTAEEHGNLMLALANMLGDSATAAGKQDGSESGDGNSRAGNLDSDQYTAALKAFGKELHKHCSHEDNLLDVLRDTMDPEKRETLLEGIAEARMTTLV
ncbi:MAG TPA: NADH-ubiquinone oxidoreductase-F iron-sulfur binding region domain-containing protein [Microthrixaceae bacterium]|nr:NADH-ubiquinone oxidoreductase-F iron-sulfur binding region domain-containing protein [Microthrixaceae bacterium]